MPAVSVNLSEEGYEIVKWVMEEEDWNRSKTINYLVRMGWIYRYKILENERKEKNERREERTG